MMMSNANAGAIAPAVRSGPSTTPATAHERTIRFPDEGPAVASSNKKQAKGGMMDVKRMKRNPRKIPDTQ
jgi:hypothetical protein